MCVNNTECFIHTIFEGRLVPQNIDENGKHLKLHLRATRNTLASRDCGNEMRLDDVDSRVEDDFEASLEVLHTRDLMVDLLDGLLVDHDPKAVLAALQVLWDHGHNVAATLVRGQIDCCRCLHFLGVGQYCGIGDTVGL